jgi:hypothetical protein
MRCALAPEQSDAARAVSKELSRTAFAAVEEMQRGEVTEGNARIAGCGPTLQVSA